VVSTPNVSSWAAILTDSTWKNEAQRVDVVSSLGGSAHLQAGFSSQKVSSMLSRIPSESAAQRRSELMAKQCTVTQGSAVALLLGAGYLEVPKLRSLFSVSVAKNVSSRQFAEQLLNKRDFGRLETVCFDI
jgi:hypothetical protein